MGTRGGDQATLDAFMNLLLDSPALDPPPGVQSNLTNPPNRGDMSLGILIPCLVVVVTMTLMRLYVKLFVVKKMHLEDYTLIVALAFEIGHFAPAFHGYTFAPILHQWDMPVRNIKKFLLNFHVGAIFYDMTILTLKLAILQQFLRIFIAQGDRSLTFWITHIVIWMNTIFYIIAVFIEIFACRPMAKLWDPLITTGKCLNTPLEYLICASFNFVLDATMLIWTQKVIWSLHMSNIRKLKLGLLFLAGLIACIFGGLGVYMNVRLLQTKDQTYIAGIMALFTFPETASGFLVLCLPVLPKFVGVIMAKIFPETPAVFTKIKERLSPRHSAALHAYPARENEREIKRQQKSLWHISTNVSMSQSVDDSIKVEPQRGNPGTADNERDSETV